MTGTLTYVVVVSCLAVLGVLIFGFFTFARGGDFNRRWSNRIMRLRVALQFVAVVLIVALAWLFGKGG